MPKRKSTEANNDEGTTPAPKKSRKEMIAESRARGREWAEQQRQERAAKAETPTRLGRPVKAPTPKVAKSEDRSEAKATRRRSSVEMTAETQKPTPERKTRSQIRAQSKAGSDAWADQTPHAESLSSPKPAPPKQGAKASRKSLSSMKTGYPTTTVPRQPRKSLPTRLQERKEMDTSSDEDEEGKDVQESKEAEDHTTMTMIISPPVPSERPTSRASRSARGEKKPAPSVGLPPPQKPTRIHLLNPSVDHGGTTPPSVPTELVKRPPSETSVAVKQHVKIAPSTMQPPPRKSAPSHSATFDVQKGTIQTPPATSELVRKPTRKPNNFVMEDLKAPLVTVPPSLPPTKKPAPVRVDQTDDATGAIRSEATQFKPDVRLPSRARVSAKKDVKTAPAVHPPQQKKFAALRLDPHSHDASDDLFVDAKAELNDEEETPFTSTSELDRLLAAHSVQAVRPSGHPWDSAQETSASAVVESTRLRFEQEIREQVLANAYSSIHSQSHSPNSKENVALPNASRSHEVLPIESPPNGHETEMIDHDSPEVSHLHPESEPPQGAKRPFLTALSALAVVIAVVTISSSLFDREFPETTPDVLVAIKPPCYAPYPETPEYLEDDPELPCDSSKGPVPCPLGGLCSGGALRSCSNPFHVVSEAGDNCTLAPVFNEILGNATSILVDWTVLHTCSLDGCSFARKGKVEGPLFPLAKLQKKLHASESLMAHSHDLIVVEGDGELLVGLSEQYRRNNLTFPLPCWLGLVVGDIFMTLVRSFLSLVALVIGFLWKFSTSYPLFALICFVSLLVLRFKRHQQREKDHLNKTVTTVKQMSYKMLMDDSQEHVVLHLRDAIADELHPTDSNGRRFIVLKVWPRVVAEVRMDNRVRKMNRTVQGKYREVWRWDAVRNTSKVTSFSAATTMN